MYFSPKETSLVFLLDTEADESENFIALNKFENRKKKLFSDFPNFQKAKADTSVCVYVCMCVCDSTFFPIQL